MGKGKSKSNVEKELVNLHKTFTKEKEIFLHKIKTKIEGEKFP